MKKTLSFLLCMAVILPFTAYGKPTIYSWTENGKTHYGELIPHGVTDYSTFSSRGIKIEDNSKANAHNTPRKNSPEVPASTGFDKKKCTLARKRVEVFSSNKTLATRDSQGKIIPLTREQINTELAKAKSDTEQYCNPSTTKHE